MTTTSDGPTRRRRGMRCATAICAFGMLCISGGGIAAAQTGKEIVEPPPSPSGPTGCPPTTFNPDASRAERGGFEPTPDPHDHPDVEDTFDGGYCQEGVDPNCGVTISCDDQSAPTDS